jgi:hypothetical protein
MINKEDYMKAISKVCKQSAPFFATLACMILAGSLSANAVNPNQVTRILTAKTITAQCCVNFGALVSVLEPAALSPVVVTWSTDYQTSGEFRVGLSVNGGACVAYGPTVAPLLSVMEVASFRVLPTSGSSFPPMGLRRE